MRMRFPAFRTLQECIRMMVLMLSRVSVKDKILEDSRYQLLFSVEEVNKLVLQGIPFRDAYKKVGIDIGQGKFTPTTTVHHTHEGSMGNLCNDKIKKMMDTHQQSFNFQQAQFAIDRLLK